jgi:hypothetical protein
MVESNQVGACVPILGVMLCNRKSRLYYYEFSLGFVRKGAAGVAGVSSSCDPSIELVLRVIRC